MARRRWTRLSTNSGVGLLDVRAVLQHGQAEVDGGGGGVDGAAIALRGEQRQVAGVVDMRVGQDDGTELGGGQSQVGVDLAGLLPLALVETAIEQDVLPGALKMVRGAGHCTCGTPELQTNPHYPASFLSVRRSGPKKRARRILRERAWGVLRVNEKCRVMTEVIALHPSKLLRNGWTTLR